MKKTREERRAFLDRIEKKYTEKLQLLHYKKESEELAKQLRTIQGMKVNEIDQTEVGLFDFPDYTLRVS